MIDLYGCPSDTPGWGRSASLVGRDRAVAIEAAITASIKDSRLLPYLQVHEVEALLFVDPVLVGERSGIDKVATELTKAVAAAGDPELVNDGAATHPSMRLVAAWPQFAKTSDVPTLIAAIGLVAIRNTCPHFDTWLTKLETI